MIPTGRVAVDPWVTLLPSLMPWRCQGRHPCYLYPLKPFGAIGLVQEMAPFTRCGGWSIHSYISAMICAILWSSSLCLWRYPCILFFCSGLFWCHMFLIPLVSIWSMWSICVRNRSIGSVAPGDTSGAMPCGFLESRVELLSSFILTKPLVANPTTNP